MTTATLPRNLMRNFHFPGRSPVLARTAMVATSHPASTLAAIEMLKSGGNAVDATIAAVAVQCVVEPQMTGIGGDCFAILWKPGKGKAKGKLIGLNASGRAPKAATAAWYAKAGIKAIETTSPHAVTVPGAIDGWARLLADHGTRSLAEVLAPAIEQAEAGYPVTARVAYDWAHLEAKVKLHPGARQHLLIDGKTPKAGDLVPCKELARTLKLIAKGGRDAFYSGEVAEDMVSELKAMGGLHTLADFAAQSSTYVDPIWVNYQGHDICELPPNLHGIVALIMLNMLKKLGKLDADPTGTQRYHMLMEAARLAYDARDIFVADPDMADVPIDTMLSDGFAAELAGRIDPKKRTENLGPIPEPKGSDTVCLSVADKDGMVVSFINSVFAGFGSGIVTRKTGIVLHNRGQGFVLDPKHRNCIGPRKRPLHTLVPAMAMKDGRPSFSFGVMGAAFQPIGHVYAVTNLLDYGMDPQEAVDGPRVFFENGNVEVEQSVPKKTFDGLKAMGHPVVWRRDPWGGAQMIAFDWEKHLFTGASDPRKDGMALGY